MDLGIVSSILQDRFPVSIAEVANIIEQKVNKRSPIIRAITAELISVFKDIASLNAFFRDQIANFSIAQYKGNVFDEPGKLADFAAAMSGADAHEIQDILETTDVEIRLQKALVLLKKELLNAQLQNKISKEVEDNIAVKQREYFLNEQLKAIKKELGIEGDGREKLITKFKDRMNKLVLPEETKIVFDEVLLRLLYFW